MCNVFNYFLNGLIHSTHTAHTYPLAGFKYNYLGVNMFNTEPKFTQNALSILEKRYLHRGLLAEEKGDLGHGQTSNATDSTTDSTTDNATSSTTAKATDSATAKATDSTTDNATSSTTAKATDSATDNATSSTTETPREMFIRVASNLALGDAKYGVSDSEIASTTGMFYDEMASLRFLPNSPALMNANTYLQQLSACFMLPVGDSLGGIFDSAKTTAIIHRSGGGTTFSFSHLRPSNMLASTDKGVSGGPVSFMGVFNAATETISHTGIRCGLNIARLHMSHPDIEEFVYAKSSGRLNLSSFTLAVVMDSEFMEAVSLNRSYDLRNPSTGEVVGSYDARGMLGKIVALTVANSGTAPRIIFDDGGSGSLQSYEACNLGSINLGKFVVGGEVDYDGLRKTVHVATHFLDNLIDMTRYPTEEIKLATTSNRKIGIGVMGLADMFALLGVSYGSAESLLIASEVMSFIRSESRVKSCELGTVRGSFVGFEESAFPGMGYSAMRNAATTTISPTRSISIIADASSGIEPYFSIAHRRVASGSDTNAVAIDSNGNFMDVAIAEGFYSQELMESIADASSLKSITDVPERWRNIFVTTYDVGSDEHISMQWAFQQHTDGLVSKTINMGENATHDDVERAIIHAHDLGCKSIDIYVHKGTTESPEPAASSVGVAVGVAVGVGGGATLPPSMDEMKPVVRARPKVLVGKTMEMMTGCGKLYVTTNMDKDGNAFEVFTRMGKVGGCASSYTEAIGRLVSVSMRAGIGVDKISRQLKGISCHMPYGFGQNKVLSCADAVGKALEEVYEDNVMISPSRKQGNDATMMDALLQGTTPPTPREKPSKKAVVVHHPGACPECGGPVSPVEGCDVCYSCGYSHCN